MFNKIMGSLPATESEAWADSRQYREEECPFRSCFMSDRDKIIQCRTFRRMADKTQVFIAHEDIHFRTRLTHTLEVFQISTAIARGLRLNEDLVSAIAMGHDLGHTPFGHAGEAALNDCLKKYGLGFHHAQQSLRVADYLERLNLTEPVRDGILKHSKGKSDLKGSGGICITPEGDLVRICDRIAYINHDIDDAVRAGIIVYEDIEKEFEGFSPRAETRRNIMAMDIFAASVEAGAIAMSRPMTDYIDRLKDYMYTHVYFAASKLANEAELQEQLKVLFDYYLEHPECITPTGSYPADPSLPIRAADYISNMTDTYAKNEIAKYVM